MSRICFDLDGTLTLPSQSDYHDPFPNMKMINILKGLYKKGHYIIIYTARGMNTYNNLGQINVALGPITFKWLDKYKIPYNEVHFGKPAADIYIDDKGCKATEKSVNKAIKKYLNK